MKQIVSNYTYSPTANCVTLTGVNIDADQLLLIVAPEAGRTLYNFASVTGSVVPGASTRVNLTASTAGLTASSPLVIYYDDQAAATSVTGTVALDPASLIALENVTVTIGSSVTVGNSVTANAFEQQLYQVIATGGDNINGIFERKSETEWYANANNLRLIYSVDNGQWEIYFDQILAAYNQTTSAIPPETGWATQGSYNSISVTKISRPVLLSNSVTIGSCVTHGVTVANSVTIASLPSISGTVTARLQDSTGIGLTSTTIGSTPRLNVTLASAITTGGSLPAVINVYGGSDSGTVRAVAVDSSGRTVVTVSNFPASQTISGTVTATLASTTVTVSALPGGALTTRFGSVTTANTAQITAAVTNTLRKYLLAQNISAGTVTIGIGFSPTTTQGIQLTAGGGLSFDAFCPTGAVYWLGSVTGAAFTILEG